MRGALLVGLAALALVPAAGATPGFRYGVAAGEMTSTSALLWTRSNELGRVRLFVWPAPRKGMPPVQITLTPSSARDRVLQRRVHGLKPGTQYTYLFSTPYRKTEIASGGTFWTAPAAGTGATVRFAISGDADARPLPGTAKPGLQRLRGLRPDQAERNNFNIILGDTIYSDTEIGGGSPAGADGARRSGRSTGRTSAPKPAQPPRGDGLLLATGTTTSSSTTSRCPEHGQRDLPRRASRRSRLQPGHLLGENGIYRTFRWGKNLELFFLDERSFRSAEGLRRRMLTTRRERLARPRRRRVADRAFAALDPGARDPGAAGLPRRDQRPRRTMLGARQCARSRRRSRRRPRPAR